MDGLMLNLSHLRVDIGTNRGTARKKEAYDDHLVLQALPCDLFAGLIQKGEVDQVTRMIWCNDQCIRLWRR